MKRLLFSSLMMLVALTACGHLQEGAKTFWGSSVRALEEKREQADQRTFSCTITECYNAVVELANEDENEGQDTVTLFLADKNKGHIVLMNIPGAIDTTQVGVFFSQAAPEKTTLDIVSLSQSAQATAAVIIFSSLKEKFGQ